MAVWDTFKLTQLAPDSNAIAKQTNTSSSWLHVMSGSRAHGYAFIGDVSGGLAVGVKRFREKYPSALEITGRPPPPPNSRSGSGPPMPRRWTRIQHPFTGSPIRPTLHFGYVLRAGRRDAGRH